MLKRDTISAVQPEAILFSEGFEKTAGVSSTLLGAQKALGKGVGTAVSGVEKAVSGTKSALKAGKAARISGYRSATKGIKREVGEATAVRRSRAATPGANLGSPEAQAKKAREDVFKRKAEMDKSKKSNKPSFAQKHPFITAGGLYLGAKAALGGGGDEKQQQPQVVPGQY